MDALDEAWSSWMRDLRLGKARLIVPDVYLVNDGRGRGAHFDPEQAVFQVVNALPNAEGLSLSAVQFAIRVAEHKETCSELMAQAVRGSGYSVQTFGENGETMATATEVVARERRSYTTRGRKINYWRGPLVRLFQTALEIDLAKFKPDGVTAQRPTLEWPDGVATDPEALGRTLQLLHAAEAVSTRIKVQMLHPDWDDAAVEEEVARIDQERGAGMPADPVGAFGAEPLDEPEPPQFDADR
jgi:A118 family predicted phage portal protein